MSGNQILDDLLRCEEGTAMTEFAITLPIFLAFFGLIAAVGALAHGTLDAQTRAAPEFWQEVYAAEDDPARMSARSEMVSNGGGLHQMLRSGGGGHWQESHRAVGEQMEATTGETIPGGVDGEPRRHLTDNPEDIIGDSRAVQGVSDDSLWPDSGRFAAPSDGASVGVTRSLFQDALHRVTHAAGVHLGVGAGVRYGDVTGGIDTTIDIGENLPTMRRSIHYSSRVGPSLQPAESLPLVDRFPRDPEARAWLTARLFVETENPYAELFNVLGDDACVAWWCTGNRLDPTANNRVPVIYESEPAAPSEPDN